MLEIEDVIILYIITIMFSFYNVIDVLRIVWLLKKYTRIKLSYRMDAYIFKISS